jgi:hypothetical protein
MREQPARLDVLAKPQGLHVDTSRDEVLCNISSSAVDQAGDGQNECVENGLTTKVLSLKVTLTNVRQYGGSEPNHEVRDLV